MTVTVIVIVIGTEICDVYGDHGDYDVHAKEAYLRDCFHCVYHFAEKNVGMNDEKAIRVGQWAKAVPGLLCMIPGLDCDCKAVCTQNSPQKKCL